MPLAFCVHGNPPVEVLSDDKPVLGPIVIAKYRGICAGCHEPIEPGDHIGAEELDPDAVEGPGAFGGDWYHYGCGR
jgi:hypothetical protein